MNLGEYGVVFRFNTSFNMSAFTAFQLTFTKPSGALLVKTNPAVSLGVVPVSTPLGTFAANEYVQYTWIVGDVDEAGEWCAQLRYDQGATIRLLSDMAHFDVLNPVCAVAA